MARPGGPAYGSRALELGVDDGLDVWELQIKLLGWGSGSDNDGIGQLLDPVKVHGTYDVTTADAVRRFQKAHGLSITGALDGSTFRAIDHEITDHPISIASLQCPCVTGKNNGPIPCRCPDHPSAGACAGFGKTRFAGKYLLDASNTAGLSSETLPVYDMEEHDGVDKAVLWAARAVMHRASLDAIKVTAGYRCWHDGYHEADETRWHHRRETLHLGKSIEFIHPGKCVLTGNAPCPECARIRGVALAKCGYQLRWLELDRVTLGEGGFGSAPPTTPFAVHLDTVQRLNREKVDFVKTDADANAPRYTDSVGVSLPVNLGDGLDPKRAEILDFYDNIEKSKGGEFPIGRGRIWHTGVHLKPSEQLSSGVHAMLEGEVVACRVGEDEHKKPFGSRNFVLLKHTWKGKPLWSLYMHLDKEGASATSKIAWRKELYLKSLDHVEALDPSPFWRLDGAKLVAGPGLGAGERVEVTGGEIDPVTLDPSAPANSKVVALKKPRKTFVYTKLAGKDVGTLHAADAALASKIKNGDVIGLEKTIKVRAGDVLSKLRKGATDPELARLGPFYHLEVFSSDQLLTDPDYVLLDASAAARVVDRKEITNMLIVSHIFPIPPDGVLLDLEIDKIGDEPNRGRFRSVILKMESAWSFDYKSAFKAAPMFGFMPDKERDALGDAFHDYAWWSDAKAGAKGMMPAAPTVFHYHPIVLLLQIAYSQ